INNCAGGKCRFTEDDIDRTGVGARRARGRRREVSIRGADHDILNPVFVEIADGKSVGAWEACEGIGRAVAAQVIVGAGAQDADVGGAWSGPQIDVEDSLKGLAADRKGAGQ